MTIPRLTESLKLHTIGSEACITIRDEWIKFMFKAFRTPYPKIINKGVAKKYFKNQFLGANFSSKMLPTHD